MLPTHRVKVYTCALSKGVQKMNSISTSEKTRAGRGSSWSHAIRRLALILTHQERFSSYLEPLVQGVLPLWTPSAYRSRVLGVRDDGDDTFSLLIAPHAKWPGFKAGQYIELGV